MTARAITVSGGPPGVAGGSGRVGSGQDNGDLLTVFNVFLFTTLGCGGGDVPEEAQTMSPPPSYLGSREV